MRTLSTSIAALALAAPLCVASAQRAEPSGESQPRSERETTEQPQLSGRFVLAQSQAQAQATVNQAIDEAVAEMSFLTRGIARRRLRERNPIRRELEIDVSGGVVSVVYGDDSYRTPDGEWATVTAAGEQTQLLHQVQGNRIYQTFRTGEGEKLTVYTLSDDGRRMWVDVTLSSPQLPSPLRYRLSYRRVGTERSPVATR